MNGKYPFSSAEMNNYLQAAETIIQTVINGEEPDDQEVLSLLTMKKELDLETLLREESEHHLEMKRQFIENFGRDVLHCNVSSDKVALGTELSQILDDCHPCVTEMHERLKYFSNYRLKFVHELIKPREAKHDTFGIRLLIECQDARRYRNEPVLYAGQIADRRVLTKDEIEALRKDPEFGWSDRAAESRIKRHMDGLFQNATTRKIIQSRFKKSYTDLTGEEKRFYKETWSQEHRGHVIDLARQVLQMKDWHPVPAYPIYVKYTGTNHRGRVRTQQIENADSTYTIDYFVSEKNSGTSRLHHYFRSLQKDGIQAMGKYGKLFVHISEQPKRQTLSQSLKYANDIIQKYRKVMRKRLDTHKVFEKILLIPAELEGSAVRTVTDIDDINERFGYLLDKDLRDWREGFTKWDWAFLRCYLDDYARQPETKDQKSGSYETVQIVLSHMGNRRIPIEVQLRTYPWHDVAEYGSASHEIYVEDKKKRIMESLKHHTGLANGALTDRFNEIMMYATALISLEKDPAGEEIIRRQFIEKRHYSNSLEQEFGSYRDTVLESGLETMAENLDILNLHLDDIKDAIKSGKALERTYENCQKQYENLMQDFACNHGVNLLEHAEQYGALAQTLGKEVNVHGDHIKNIVGFSQTAATGGVVNKVLASLGVLVLRDYEKNFGKKVPARMYKENGISLIRKKFYGMKDFQLHRLGTTIYLPKEHDLSRLQGKYKAVLKMAMDRHGFSDNMCKAYLMAYDTLLSLRR